MPSLEEYQEAVDDWISQFEEGYWPPLAMLARLTEETGELARDLNHEHGEKPKKDGGADIEGEIGDILFTLACLANRLDISLDEAMQQALETAEVRDSDRWTRKQ